MFYFMSDSVDGRKDLTLARIDLEEPQEDEHVVGVSHGILFGVFSIFHFRTFIYVNITIV